MKHSKLLRRMLPLLLAWAGLATTVRGQEVIASAGDYLANGSGSVSWTLGEAVIETFQGGSYILTQGFQQTNFELTPIRQIPGIDLRMWAFPNPVQEEVTLRLSVLPSESLNLILFDAAGKQRKAKELTAIDTQLSLHDLPAGSYRLAVFYRNQVVSTQQIIKP